MKYFTVADIHGHYDKFKIELERKGFDVENPAHKLVICGDLMDRGRQPEKLQNYIMELLVRDKVILVKGNHEDLVLEMIENFTDYAYRIDYTHHAQNGTFKTMLDLIHMGKANAINNPGRFKALARQTDYIKRIIPRMVDYFETENYVFVHGWIPCITEKHIPTNELQRKTYKYNREWRNATKSDWVLARWFNGMDCAMKWKVLEPNKTIICGHKPCDYGHEKYGNGKKENFNPFMSEGIIAIDACTVYSGKVNVVVIED